jgi:hypothetical protein
MEGGAEMLRNTLKQQARADYLRRIENSARTLDEFKEVVETYDKLDANRERRERYHEIRQGDYNLQYTGSKRNGYKLTYIETGNKNDTADTGRKDKLIEPGQKDNRAKSKKKESSTNYTFINGEIIPGPICHPYWRELMQGDFISYIFDSALEIWQIFDNWQVGKLYRNELTIKQKETLFLSAVRRATTEQIGCYTGKTDRAVRRLLADALENIRKPLAIMIQARLDDELPETLEKQRFLEWYGQQQRQIEQKKRHLKLPNAKQAEDR